MRGKVNQTRVAKRCCLPNSHPAAAGEGHPTHIVQARPAGQNQCFLENYRLGPRFGKLQSFGLLPLGRCLARDRAQTHRVRPTVPLRNSFEHRPKSQIKQYSSFPRMRRSFGSCG